MAPAHHGRERVGDRRLSVTDRRNTWNSPLSGGTENAFPEGGKAL